MAEPEVAERVAQAVDGRPPVLPRLLVLSYFGEGWTTGGAVIVDSLLRHYPADLVARVCVALRGGSREGASSEGAFSVPTLAVPHVPGLFRPGFRLAATEYASWVSARRQARAALRFEREQRSEQAWIVLDYTWVLTAHRYMAGTVLPVHVTVHDDPVASMAHIGWPARMRRRVEDAFESCYVNAASRDVVSEGMRRLYLSRYGKDAVVVPPAVRSALPRTSVPLTSAPAAPPGRRPGSAPRVAHVGNALHPEEFTAFANALHEGWGADKALAHYGSQPGWLAALGGAGTVRLHGWVALKELQEILRDRFDWGYLPYSFAPERRTFVETSFPTKLLTYLASGIPVIYHGPAYSSVAVFLREYRVGVMCDSQDTAAIRRTIAAVSPEAWGEMRAEGARALAERFDERLVAGRWLDALMRGRHDGVAHPPGRAAP